jgi:hypothetical protein
VDARSACSLPGEVRKLPVFRMVWTERQRACVACRCHCSAQRLARLYTPRWYSVCAAQSDMRLLREQECCVYVAEERVRRICRVSQREGRAEVCVFKGVLCWSVASRLSRNWAAARVNLERGG